MFWRCAHTTKMEVLEDFQHVSKHLFTHTCTFNKSNMAGSSRVGVKMCTLMEGSRRSPCVLHERKKVYTCGHLFSRMNSPIMPHTPAAGPATANRFFAFAAAHTDREPHIRDWQNVCIMASKIALSADFTTDDDVEWPLKEGNAESSLQTVT